MNKSELNMSDVQKHQEEYEKFLNESPFRSEIDKICKDIVEQKDNAMATEFTKVICDLLRANGVYVHCTETKFSEKITENSIEEKYGIFFDGMDFSEHDKVFTDEIEKLKQELHRKETTINQIDDILNELFGVTHDIVEMPGEFKKTLKEKIENGKTIVDFLPTEPIKVADMLIDTYMSGYEKYVHDFCEANAGDLVVGDPCEEVRKQIVSHIRQIAEHLLIYCNANGEGE